MTNRIKFSGLVLGAILSVFFASPVDAALVLCVPPTYPPTIAEQQAYVNCQKQYLDEPKEEQEKRAEENRIYQERSATLAPYAQFFDEVGVDLSTSTSESKYKKWLKDLAEAKVDYDDEQQRLKELAEKEVADKVRKEAEARAKLKELEDRVKMLESQKPVVPTIPTQKTSEPAQTAVSSAAQTDPEAIIEDDSDIVPATITESIPQPTPKVHWFARFINWLTGK